MAHLESLLLADANPRSRDALVFGFDREGVAVHALTNLDDLAESVRSRKPQLVVASIERMEGAKSLALLTEIGRLRDEPGTRDLPIVVVGERAAREEALRAGADEFVALPAFIRDVVTLSRLALSVRQDGDDTGVAGMLDDYGLYFLVRGLAVAGRSGVLELERAGRVGEVQLVRGEVVAAKLGRLTGVAAFEQMLLWQDATLHFRFSAPAGEREIKESVETLLEQGADFVRVFEASATRVGGVQAVYQHEASRAHRVRAHIPQEVQEFIENYDGERTLLDLLEDSPFKPLDTVKITFRLFQLGAIERRDANRDAPQVTAQLAVRDWLLGIAGNEPRQTVTEAGRRAAEAYAEEEAARARSESPSDDLFVAESLAAAISKTPTAPVAASSIEQATPEPRPAEEDATTGPVKKTRAKKRRQDETPSAGVALDSAKTERRKKVQPVAKERRATGERRKKKARTDQTPDSMLTTPFERADITPPEAMRFEREVPKLPSVIVEPAPSTLPNDSTPFRKQQLAFDDVEEEFFAAESELQRVAPVESFDDLESTPKPKVPPKRGWFGFGKKR